MSELPTFVGLQEPRPVRLAPIGLEWVHEPRLPGLRVLLRADETSVRWLDRNRQDRSKLFRDAGKGLVRLTPCLIDCQISSLGADGRFSRDAAVGALRRRSAGDMESGLVVWALDLLFWAGEDTRRLAYQERRAWLDGMLPEEAGSVVFGYPPALGASAQGALVAKRPPAGMTEVISKRVDAPYRSNGRPGTWLKSPFPGEIVATAPSGFLSSSLRRLFSGAAVEPWP